MRHSCRCASGTHPARVAGWLSLVVILLFNAVPASNTAAQTPRGWAYTEHYPWIYYANTDRFYFTVEPGLWLADPVSKEVWALGRPAATRSYDLHGIFLSPSSLSAQQGTLLINSSADSDLVWRETSSTFADVKFHVASSSILADVTIMLSNSPTAFGTDITVSTSPRRPDFSYGIVNHGPADLTFAFVNSSILADISIYFTTSYVFADYVIHFRDLPRLYDREFVALLTYLYFFAD